MRPALEDLNESIGETEAMLIMCEQRLAEYRRVVAANESEYAMLQARLADFRLAIEELSK